MSRQGRNSGAKYRLPTEVEWEYAARGGQTYKYAGSNNIDEVAWYDGKLPTEQAWHTEGRHIP
jgi:formylglycine-generating enzyme required for sulfatase activity